MSQFIPGIYNYCDRWCERCTFTSKCGSFENISNLPAEQLDQNNKIFWQSISGNLQMAIDTLSKTATSMGIDINRPVPDEDAEEVNQSKEAEDEILQHPLHVFCARYIAVINPFLQNDAFVKNKQTDLINALMLDVEPADALSITAQNISSYYEIIHWYQYFLSAKFQRALSGKFEDNDDDIQSDSNGSAKIAIDSIDKSMAAWISLYHIMPGAEDTALPALAILQQLKQKAAETFPDATKFIRPGFDDEID